MFKKIASFCSILQACVALSAQTPAPQSQPEPQVQPQAQPQVSPPVQSTELPAQSTETPTPPSPHEERSLVREYWVTAAEMLAEKVDDADARQIATFLRTNNVLGIPIPTGARPVEEPKTPDVFMLIPLLPADKSLTGMWSIYVNNKKVAGVYQPARKTLILRAFEPVSPTWTGIVMIHEGMHVRTTLVTKFNYMDLKAYSEHERDTHEMQNRLVKKLGGEAYEAFVLKISTEIEASARTAAQLEKIADPGTVIIDRADSYPELESLFEPSLSQLEKDIRAQHVWVHAYYLFYERLYGEQAPKQKAQFAFNIAFRTGAVKPPVKK